MGAGWGAVLTGGRADQLGMVAEGVGVGGGVGIGGVGIGGVGGVGAI